MGLRVGDIPFALEREAFALEWFRRYVEEHGIFKFSAQSTGRSFA
jgi:hypothetical protein